MKEQMNNQNPPANQPMYGSVGGIFITATVSLFVSGFPLDNTSSLLYKVVYTSILGLQVRLWETKMSHLQVITEALQILRISGHCCAKMQSTLHTVYWLCLLVIR